MNRGKQYLYGDEEAMQILDDNGPPSGESEEDDPVDEEFLQDKPF